MRLTRLLNVALLTTVLAGCGQTALTGALSTAGSASQALSTANDDTFVDPRTTELPNDPIALPGAPRFEPRGGEVPGIDIVNFRQVSPTLYRGGLPSKDDIFALKKLGVKTDIDLMGELPVYDTVMVAREKRWCKAAGINFVQVKVPTGSVPGMKKISQAVADAFLKVALDPANQPCFVHCFHGRDRTGTMVAVYRMTVDHYTNQQALDEMKTFGFSPKKYPQLAAFVESYKVPAATAK